MDTRERGRVARWFILRPKIPIWVYFGGPWNGKCWYILRSFDIIYDNLVKYMAVWYSFWYVWTKKNLATLERSTAYSENEQL
jgi:hypothetical protein